MSWAITRGRVAGIAVRVHVFFLVFVAVQLLQPAFGTSPIHFVDAVLMVVILFWIVLLHEFGHCAACRFSGGEADELRRAMAAWKRKGGVHRFERRIFEGMAARGYPKEFAESIERNSVHGSDSAETAKLEIDLNFKPEEIVG